MKRRLITSIIMALMLVATLSLPAIAADEGTVTASVTITSFISITITDAPAAGIHFGSLAPGTTSNPDTDASAGTPSIIVTNDAGSTSNVTLQIKGTDFVASTFTIANAKYSLTYAGAKTEMSASYATFATDVAPSGARTIWHWLDVPSSGVTAGAYNSTFSYKAIAQ